jgi:hypothetical protein
MASRVGNLVNLWLAVEGTRGTAETTGGFWIAKATLTETSEITKAEMNGTYNNIYTTVEDRTISRLERVSFEFQVTPSNIGMVMIALTGDQPTATGSTIYTHEFTEDLDSNIHQSLTIGIQNLESGTPKILQNSMLESLTLNHTAGAGGGFLTATATFVGVISTSTTIPALSYDADELPFAPRHLNLKFADEGSSPLSGTQFCPRDFSMTFTKNTLPDFGFCGSDNPREIYNQANTVEGSFTITWDDSSTPWKDAYEADIGDLALRIAWVDDDTTIGGDNPELLLVTDKTSITSRQTNIPNTEIITEQVNFKTHYRRTAGSAFDTISVKNAVSAY